ncbi:hypothetical protein SUGI_0064050 [Cryptomeria japonica]|nr:hypothetical protein SUGI_0064050 [Cryptomeria japonica]
MPNFEIHCRKNLSFGTTRPIPFLPTLYGELQILNASDNHILISSASLFSSDCRNDSSKTFGLPAGSPFRVSANNTYVTVGCRTTGMLVLGDYPDGQWGGCVSMCDNSPSLSYCTGNGCCRTSIPSNISHYSLGVEPLIAPLINASYNSVCGYSAIVDPLSWDMFPQSNVFTFDYKKYWMLLDWAIAGDSCSTAKPKSSYQCDLNAQCRDLEWGYLCSCKSGFLGDGYANGTGCTDIDECSDPGFKDCFRGGGRCENTEGSYQCYYAYSSGNGTWNGARSLSLVQDLFLHIGSGVILACLLGWAAVVLNNERRKSWLDKQNNFQRNGGPHLQRLISSQGKLVRIFSLEEIKKATKNFHESLVLGSGASGTIYKGILPRDGTIVAIKKSKDVDSEDMDQFINEVIILSKINHKNVVVLLGCCLETSVPLLVYEYVSNGTLFSHLHEKDHLSWQIRLRIAMETAEALSYLHSAASTPIVHRDREKNQTNLAIFFLSTLKADGLFGIMDYRLHTEDVTTLESIKLVGNLAKRCLSVEGDKRPSMDEVVRELRWITRGIGGLDETECSVATVGEEV